jgi:phospho-N-acetylmuramoyl-pentapeptide-transferase
MLYHLLYPLTDHISGLNVFRYITFRSAGAMATAIIICLLLGPYFINQLKKRQVREKIREEGPESHLSKEGTPTMGGLIILAGIVIPTLLWADLTNYCIYLVLGVTIGLGLIGYMDDYLKAIKHKPKGLVGRAKMAGQVILGLGFGLGLTYLAPDGLYNGTTDVPFFKNILLTLGIMYIPFIILVITGTSNAVNLTDGLDGLAIGLCAICFITFAAIAYVAGRIDFSDYLGIEHIVGAGELAVFSAAVIGAALGFLWFNSYPAEVFMGDTGSLPLGGALGAIAILLKKELLLVVVGGVFVLEALSVIIQVLSYRYRGKRRVFKMAPIHHHFELLGWPESKVVIRFWILGALFALATLATLKVR